MSIQYSEDNDSWGSICLYGDRDRNGEEALATLLEETTSLQRVNLGHCKLMEIPRRLFQDDTMNQITHLLLPFNKIEIIPSLSGMRALRQLNISHNRVSHIESLPENLKIIRCNNNDLANLKCMGSLPHLEEIWLSHNKLPWTEFVHLVGNVSLQAIVKLGNPADEKQKFLEFLVSVVPSLRSIDGISVVTLVAASTESFLQSSDGRQMMHQVRPLLSADQKRMLLLVRENPGNSITQVVESNNSVTTAPLKDCAIQVESKPAKAKTISSGYGQKPKASKKVTANENSSISNLEVPIENDAEVNEVGTAAAAIPIVSVSQTLRFGEADDSPIAACLYDDGSGYVRWSKSGPMACSIENGKLLACFSTGSIACILDKAGNGSVMNSKGKCLLLISDKGLAKVLDKKGAVLIEYDRESQLAQGISSLEADSKLAQPLSPDGSAIFNDDSGIPISTRKLPHAEKLHRWNSDGLVIDFIPKKWEVKIKVSNSRLVCEFSSISGGKVIKEHEIIDKVTARQLAQQRNALINANSKIEQLTNDEHESLRSGLQSIMSDLDSVMASIGTKKV